VIRINLLPVREARRQAGLRRQALLLGAAVGAGVLICVGLHTWVTSAIAAHQRQLQAKKEELKRLEATSQEVKRFEQERAEIEAKLAVISQLEQARHGPVRLLDTVATQIPRRVWLTHLSAREGELQLEGRSLDAEIVAEFVNSLEASPVVSNVELQETQLREIEGLKLNTFKLRAQYLHPKPRVPPAQGKGAKKKRGGKGGRGRAAPAGDA
jgi:type IV pilus assembly protein PilN